MLVFPHCRSVAINGNNAPGKLDHENYISIQGASNINEFELINRNPSINKLSAENTKNNKYQNIQISVDDFTGSNERVVKDFREMVDAGNYPFIKISIEQKELADFDETTGLTNFKTKISIAGTSREYIVPCQIESRLDNGYVLSGNFLIKLTDFGIGPPEKLLGLVQVKNEVFINFVFSFGTDEVLTEKI
jgi:hypothetical protein